MKLGFIPPPPISAAKAREGPTLILTSQKVSSVIMLSAAKQSVIMESHYSACPYAEHLRGRIHNTTFSL